MLDQTARLVNKGVTGDGMVESSSQTSVSFMADGAGDLRAVTDAIPALISYYDADHVCRFANAFHQTWYGRPPADLVGRHMSDFIGEPAYADRIPYLEQVARGERVEFDAKVPHHDGDLRDADIHYVPKMGPDGFEGFYVLVSDVARQVEALRRSEFRYRNVFQAMAVSFWELDFNGLGGMLRDLKMQGVTDMRAHVAANPGIVREMMKRSIVIDVNDKSLQMFEATREDLLGPVDRFWPRSSEWLFAEAVYAAVERRHSLEAEAKFRTLDGREFDALFTCCYPRESVGQGAILVGVVDISERLKAQDELHRVQGELAHAARVSTLGELTASIAHEVNQPLAAIVTNGEASLRWLDRAEPDLDEAKAAIGRMISEGQRASDIISRIRAMSTKSGPEPAALELNPLIEDALLLVRRELVSHDVNLRLLLAPDLPTVKADRVQIQQLVINLAVNAVQAMAQLAGSVRDLTISTARDGETLVVEVADTGPGVAAEDADRLFNAFFTTKPTGMGMGLSICKSIVEAHDGRIATRPGEAGGAVFSFTLPIAGES